MITEFFVRTFIKNREKTEDYRVRAQYGILEGWVSTVINLILFAFKLAAGLFVNSIALITDAVHSLSDMLSSIAVIWGFKISAQPPDREHPFGHGRMEHVTTLIIAILLIITGFEFARVAFGRVTHAEPVVFNLPVIIIVSITIVFKEWLSKFARELGRRIDSKALEGDALHHKADVITSVMVILVLFSEKIHFRQFDGVVGILISVYIMYSGWKMLQDVITPLLGESATYEELAEIKKIAKSVKGIKGTHDIMMHKYGSMKVISLHVEIPEEFPFMEAHNLIEEIEENINVKMGAITTIHLDPIQKLNDDLRQVHSILGGIIKSNPGLNSYHDLRMLKVKGALTLVVDVVASHGVNPDEIIALRDKVASSLRTTLPFYQIKIWIDHPFNVTPSPK
jgi:cation diffusion facilitator family transporter